MSLVYVNGQMQPAQSAQVSARDRGFLLGDGLFETLAAYRGRILGLDQHLTRLQHGANVLGFDPPPAAELAAAARHTLAANGLQAQDAILRLTVSRGAGPRGLLPPAQPTPTVVITAAPWAVAAPAAQTAISVPFRWDAASPLAGLKTLNYLPQILGRQAAQVAGATEGIFLNHAGHLVEGCASNLFWVSDGALFTPALACGPLPGVTRAFVLALAAGLQLPVVEGAFPRAQLLQAAEAFLTNSLIELAPLTWYDGQPIGRGEPGPLTRRLQAAFRTMITSGLP
ncbi:MAG: aminotransferase class IV [Anaerolineae bacterium]|uniref:aminotransferase class IV n=1 Tax=Candidatus Amarolinea dominans TaxID=3140696 RepID=UPI003134E50A|nr:aminotransferase class IV [Anaerolineae bacterium]